MLSGTYNILEEIGKGSGGTVYKAYHNRLHKVVVMKKLNNPGRSVIKNRQEVDILKNLNHTYLPQVLDFFEEDGNVYTVMSFIEGESFYDLMKKGAAFSRKELLKWSVQLCSAVNYLHTRKIPVIHGDIKPSNVMLTPEGNICLIDFNISFFLDENTVLGYTDGYTSPEQYLAVSAKRKKGTSKFVIDQKADIYSVGATLYHMATGKKRAHFENKIDMERLTEALGAPFAQIIAKAVEVEPVNRFKTIQEMYEALEDLPRRDQRYRALLKKQRNQLIGFIAGAVIFAGVACFGFLTMQNEKLDRYDDLVDAQIAFMEEGDFSAATEEYYEARELMPSELEAYYQQAYSLYLQGRYEENIEFIENEVLNNGDVKLQGRRMVDLHTLEGLSYIELGDGASAVEQYVKAQEYGAFEGENYRNYAIALAYDNQFEKAQEMLDEAEKFGMEEAALSYTRGELHYAKGEYDAALASFNSCIETAEDMYMCMRAYLMANKIYRMNGDLQSSRALLTEAVDRLPAQNQLVILEALIQTDIDLSETAGGSYGWEAIEYLQRVISNKWAGYSDYDTLAVLYLKEGDISATSEILAEMLELYGEDYNINKRYALTEVVYQGMLSQEQRDYSDFLHYYDRATTLWQTESRGNNTDAEMQLLEDAYRQLQTGGWL